MQPRLLWCLGMYASASTWAFNVARQLHEHAGTAPQRSTFFSGRGDLSALSTPGVHWIVKSHEISDEPTVLGLAARATHILVTMRDPRDAVTSLMLYHGYGFAQSLPLVAAATRLCAGFARDRRARLWHYESGFFKNPETPAHLAEWLDYRLAPSAAAAIFAANQRAEVEKHIAKLDRLPDVLTDRASGDRLDPRTHWHTHHAGRSGEIGRWRAGLSHEQAAEVEHALRDCYAFTR